MIDDKISSAIVRRCLLKQFICFLFVLLSHTSILLANDELDIEIEQLICEKLNCDKTTLEIQYESQEKLQHIKQKTSIIEEITLLKFDPTYSNFKARIKYNDSSYEDIFGRYESFIAVPVVSRYIRAGTIISTEDVFTLKTKASKVKSLYLTSETDVIGKLARKNLNTGAMIKAADLVRPPVIKQNDPVNIVYISDGIKLKTSGISLGSGAVGEMLKVQNEDTGVVLLGQIINKNTVRVGGNDE